MPYFIRHFNKTLLLATFLGFVSIEGCFSQGELDNETKEFYRNEKTLALEANSQGWGFGVRYGKRQDGFRKKLYEISFTTVRHPQEIKLSGQGGRFVYGKLNNLYSLQAMIGRQKEHYGKFDKGGVAIRSVIAAGISAAIVKPYYYIVFDKDGKKTSAQYNLDNTDIYARAPYFYGIGNTYLSPGICARSAVNFEFGRSDKKIQALELGIAAHAYAQEIRLMATEDSRFWYVNLFIAYRFGKITGKK